MPFEHLSLSPRLVNLLENYSKPEEKTAFLHRLAFSSTLRGASRPGFVTGKRLGPKQFCGFVVLWVPFVPQALALGKTE